MVPDAASSETISARKLLRSTGTWPFGLRNVTGAPSSREGRGGMTAAYRLTLPRRPGSATGVDDLCGKVGGRGCHREACLY